MCVWDHIFIELLFSEDGKYLFLKHYWFHNISCSHFHIILLHPILIIGLLQKICNKSLCLFRIDNIRTWWEEKNTYERLDGEEALVPYPERYYWLQFLPNLSRVILCMNKPCVYVLTQVVVEFIHFPVPFDFLNVYILIIYIFLWNHQQKLHDQKGIFLVFSAHCNNKGIV